MIENGWLGIGLFLFGFAVFLIGVYIKAGPEWTAIFGGGALAYAGYVVVREGD